MSRFKVALVGLRTVYVQAHSVVIINRDVGGRGVWAIFGRVASGDGIRLLIAETRPVDGSDPQARRAVVVAARTRIKLTRARPRSPLNLTARATASVVQCGNAQDAGREVSKPSGDAEPCHQHTIINHDEKLSSTPNW